MPRSSSRAAEPQGLDASGLEHLIGYLLALAEVPTRAIFTRHVGRPFGLRPVEFTLLELLRSNADVSPKQIASALRMPAPHVTLLLDRLARRGLLERHRDPADGRALRVRLTPAGRELAGRAARVARGMEDELGAVLTGPERQRLRRLLLKLADAPTD